MASLADVTAAPIPFDTDRGHDARALYEGLPQNLLDLIEGTAACSPYLGQSLRREQTWLRAVHTLPLQKIATELMVVEGADFQTLSDNLRIAKRRISLLIALADLGGLWDLKQVTNTLTDFADSAVQTALEHLVGVEIKRGKLPGCDEADIPQAAGMVALAMGKMGAGELNYSSDIDLIMLFDESRHDPDNWAELRSRFIRITQRMVKLLSDSTGEGYVFRTDLRLRPDPSVTPVCIAMEPAERYYESLGRTWERAAFIKARPCAGAIDAGWAFLDRLRPFIWRRHLDYAAIEDAHDMRLRIREHKGLHGPISVPGHNMKLGRGGIREIEFFAQTRQIICGGRDDGLRSRETLVSLAALAQKDWIGKDAARELSAAYIAHRTLEHRIQMIDDAQTHDFPTDAEKRQRLAAFCGEPDPQVFEETVKTRLKRVHEIIEAFFAPDEEAEAVNHDGFRDGFIDEMVEKWQTYPAMRSERSRRIFTRLQPRIMAQLALAAHPDEALIQFDSFLAGLPAGVQVFSLFDANPDLLDLLVDICATAPELASYLGRNARVLEAVIGSGFFEPLPDLQVMTGDLRVLEQKAADYEDKLDAVRIWAQEQRFRIGVHLLRGISEPAEAATAYSDVAEACVLVLFDAATAHFSTRYGPPPGKGAAVIAMGKLGSRQMTARSDLDLIVIYDADGESASTGKRSLAIQPYYARLTQAFVSSLTVATSKGALYEVDMRLRPSGRSGPVATSVKGFEDYQNNQAWVWEHMALLRARVVAGALPVRDAVSRVMANVLARPYVAELVLPAVREMRQRLGDAKQKPAANVWEVKHGAGRMMDVELLMQAGTLINNITVNGKPGEMAHQLRERGWLTPAQEIQIQDALKLYAGLQMIGRLAVEGALTPEKAGRGAMMLVLKQVGVSDSAALEQKLDQTRISMERLIEGKLS